MAKIMLKNCRPHSITINMESEQIVVPAATKKIVKEGETSREELVHGTAEADQSTVEAACKKHKVVAHYFKEKWLEVARPEATKDKE